MTHELTKWIRRHPISVILILVIWYLSLFTPPKIELANVRFIDKWAPTDVRFLSVHLVDGGLACSEDFHLHATCPCPLHRPGSHEWPHRIGTSLLHHQPDR